MNILKRLKKLMQAQLTISPRIIMSQLRRTRTEKTLEKFLIKNKNIEYSKKLSIDLGSNSIIRNPFLAKKTLGLDIDNSAKNGSVVQCDIFNQKIPLHDNEVDYVTAFDFIEHIPRLVVEKGSSRFVFVEVMNEIYRVLKIDGIFLSYTPAYPFKEAFMDPTHVNFITEDTFEYYFCKSENENDKCIANIYGFKGEFQLIDQAWIDFRLVTILKKIK
jgi:SAM-dependent methyltransferase